MAAAPAAETPSPSVTASNTAAGAAGEYPVPLTPPYPALSKEVELRRATSAEARSGALTAADFAVVYEDEWLAVVDKPSGIYCDAILSSFSSSCGLKTQESNLHLANRLDRDTSGLMVITKCNKVSARLVRSFTNHEVRKTYLALCVGPTPRWDRIKLISGHGRSKFGAWRVYSLSDVGRSLPGGSIVKKMISSFEILGVNGRGKFKDPIDVDSLTDREIESIVVQERCAGDNTGDEIGERKEIFVRAYPESGRTHQIRLHCQYLGLPIRGDVKYGGVYQWNGVIWNFHALHAESLLFEHPITGSPLSLRAPLPVWAHELVESMSQD